MAKKLNYEVVLFGKELRKMQRAKKKIKTGLDVSPLGSMRPRRERKLVAKQLKMPFIPRYNGLVFKLKHEIFTNERGYMRVKSVMVEAK